MISCQIYKKQKKETLENVSVKKMEKIVSGIQGKLPVLWHQSLLAFAQRYRNDITEEQRDSLLDLLRSKGHSAISPEVRRELLEGRNRGVIVDLQSTCEGGDDTMMIDRL